MLTKEQISETVEKLPERISLDEMIDRLMFIEKVNDGWEQSEKGMICSEEDEKQILSEWLE